MFKKSPRQLCLSQENFSCFALNRYVGVVKPGNIAPSGEGGSPEASAPQPVKKPREKMDPADMKDIERKRVEAEAIRKRQEAKPAERKEKKPLTFENEVGEIGKRLGMDIRVSPNFKPETVRLQLAKIAAILQKLDLASREILNITPLILSDKNTLVEYFDQGAFAQINIADSESVLLPHVRAIAENAKILPRGNFKIENEKLAEALGKKIMFMNIRAAYKNYKNEGRIVWSGPNTHPNTGYVWAEPGQEPRYNYAVLSLKEAAEHEAYRNGTKPPSPLVKGFSERPPEEIAAEAAQEKAEQKAKEKAERPPATLENVKQNQKKLDAKVKKLIARFKSYDIPEDTFQSGVKVVNENDEQEIQDINDKLEALLENFPNLEKAIGLLSKDENNMGIFKEYLFVMLHTEDVEGAIRQKKPTNNEVWVFDLNIAMPPEEIKNAILARIKELKKNEVFLGDSDGEKKQREKTPPDAEYKNMHQAIADGDIIYQKKIQDYSPKKGYDYIEDNSNYAIETIAVHKARIAAIQRAAAEKAEQKRLAEEAKKKAIEDAEAVVWNGEFKIDDDRKYNGTFRKLRDGNLDKINGEMRYQGRLVSTYKDGVETKIEQSRHTATEIGGGVWEIKLSYPELSADKVSSKCNLKLPAGSVIKYGAREGHNVLSITIGGITGFLDFKQDRIPVPGGKLFDTYGVYYKENMWHLDTKKNNIEQSILSLIPAKGFEVVRFWSYSDGEEHYDYQKVKNNIENIKAGIASASDTLLRNKNPDVAIAMKNIGIMMNNTGFNPMADEGYMVNKDGYKWIAIDPDEDAEDIAKDIVKGIEKDMDKNPVTYSAKNGESVRFDSAKKKYFAKILGADEKWYDKEFSVESKIMTYNWSEQMRSINGIDNVRCLEIGADKKGADIIGQVYYDSYWNLRVNSVNPRYGMKVENNNKVIITPKKGK